MQVNILHLYFTLLIVFLLVNRDGLNPRKLSFSTNEVSIRQALSRMQNYDCSCDVCLLILYIYQSFKSISELID